MLKFNKCYIPLLRVVDKVREMESMEEELSKRMGETKEEQSFH